MMQDGLLGNAIQRDGDAMLYPPGNHLDGSLFAPSDIRSRPYTLQRIAKLPTARAHVVRLIAHPDEIIERALDRRGWQPLAVILHTEGVIPQGHFDIWENPSRFAGIEGVINQLFEERNRPCRHWEADLHL
jgi:hypothetical protein